MADLVITAASVVKGSNATVTNGTAGTSITAGQVVYQDTGDSNKMKLTDVDGGSAIMKNANGIALHASSNGQPLQYQTAGDITIGATLVAGQVYVASDTAGGIMPIADLDSGDRVAILGYAKSTTVLFLDIVNTGVDFA